jgi:predicted Fe-Mo cluster-binding NifX family protein
VLAIPLHGDEVAPRFCSSTEFMVVELNERAVSRVSRLLVPDEAWSQRLEQLARAGVTTLLCGGFNRSYLPMARGLGLQVVPGLAGNAAEIVEAFLNDELDRFTFVPCAKASRKRKMPW